MAPILSTNRCNVVRSPILFTHRCKVASSPAEFPLGVKMSPLPLISFDKGYKFLHCDSLILVEMMFPIGFYKVVNGILKNIVSMYKTYQNG